MPFNELQRRDSWPPTIVRIHNEDADTSDAIDDNPFAFFLTSPEELDEFFDDDDALSAGIETPDSAKSPVREISPSALQRAPLDDDDDDDDEDYDFGLAMPLSLKDFTFKHNSGRKSRAEQRQKDGLTGLGITLQQNAALRGRARVQLVPSRGRGRGQTRSLSNRRKNSWREPSPEIFTITEERESDDDAKHEGGKESEILVSSSAPASTQIGTLPIDIPKKPKKRVHWAF